MTGRAALLAASLCFYCMLGVVAAPAGAAAAQAPAPQQAPAGWQTYQFRAARFSVLLPDKPATGQRSIRTEFGNVAATRHTTTDTANVTYDVLVNVYPKKITQTSPDQLLSGARDSLMYQINGRLLKDAPFTLEGLPAREIEVVGGSGTHYRARLIWVENRLYQLMTVTHGKPRAESQAFFDSFQLLGR